MFSDMPLVTPAYCILLFFQLIIVVELASVLPWDTVYRVFTMFGYGSTGKVMITLEANLVTTTVFIVRGLVTHRCFTIFLINRILCLERVYLLIFVL